MQSELILAGGTVLTADGPVEADVRIADGRIAEIGTGLDGDETDRLHRNLGRSRAWWISTLTSESPAKSGRRTSRPDRGRRRPVATPPWW